MLAGTADPPLFLQVALKVVPSREKSEQEETKLVSDDAYGVAEACRGATPRTLVGLENRLSDHGAAFHGHTEGTGWGVELARRQ